MSAVACICGIVLVTSSLASVESLSSLGSLVSRRSVRRVALVTLVTCVRSVVFVAWVTCRWCHRPGCPGLRWSVFHRLGWRYRFLEVPARPGPKYRRDHQVLGHWSVRLHRSRDNKARTSLGADLRASRKRPARIGSMYRRRRDSMAICTRTLSGAHRCVGNVVGKSGLSVRIEGQCPRCQQERHRELYAVPHGVNHSQGLL